MTQLAPEQLSALVDGELPRDEALFLFRRLQHDHTLGERWSRYHVARHALRRHEIVPLRVDFSQVIAARIELEIAPGVSRTRPMLRWISGGAIAASVAVAALMVTGPTRPALDPAAQEGLAAVPESPAAAASPAASPVPPVLHGEFRVPMLSPSLDVQPASAATSGFSTPSSPMDPRLQSYLIRHYDASGSAGQAVLMPYVLLLVPSQQQATAVSPAAENSSQRH